MGIDFAQTETQWFWDYVWTQATGMLFMKIRLFFYNKDGSAASNMAGAPSILVAYGEKDAQALKKCKIQGAYCEWATTKL